MTVNVRQDFLLVFDQYQHKFNLLQPHRDVNLFFYERILQITVLILHLLDPIFKSLLT